MKILATMMAVLLAGVLACGCSKNKEGTEKGEKSGGPEAANQETGDIPDEPDDPNVVP
jgi:hypothetical protein